MIQGMKFIAAVPALAALVLAPFVPVAQAQTVPAINSCKNQALADLSSRPLQVGESIEIQSPSGPVTLTARAGESIWDLCTITMRASEAFLPKIAAAQAEMDAQRTAAQRQQEAAGTLQAEVARLQEQLAAARAQAAAAPAGTPAPVAETGSSGSSEGDEGIASDGLQIWLPWVIAALAALAAVVFFIRSANLSRLLSQSERSPGMARYSGR